MTDSPPPLILRTRSAVATRRVANTLARALPVPSVVALRGDLGAGKTTFVQGWVAALRGGERVRVQSPTFALARTYPTTPPLHHLDLYRLESEDAAFELGLVELIQADDAHVCVEWSERAPGLFATECVGVTLDGAGRSRTITLALPASLLVSGTLQADLRAAARSPQTKR